MIMNVIYSVNRIYDVIGRKRCIELAVNELVVSELVVSELVESVESVEMNNEAIYLHQRYLDCFVPYNDEVVNPHNIRNSGLLRSARNDGDMNRHQSFLQGIYPMPAARNDETRISVIARHEAIQIEALVSGLLRSARNDGDLYRHHSFLQGIFPIDGDLYRHHSFLRGIGLNK